LVAERLALKLGSAKVVCFELKKKKHEYHPYHLELHQELHGEDLANRVAFCEWAEKKIRNAEHFFERVVFTDECCVKNNGVVNKYNLHYWAIQNPHWMREQDIQNR
jgi:hypothetical protein